MGDYMAAISWRQAYRNVLTEQDKDKLTKAVHDAELSIQKRIRELEGQDDEAERREIRAANADLLAIKIHKLGWPCTKTTN